MGWNIWGVNDGFGVVLGPELPALLSTHLRPGFRGFPCRVKSMSLGDFDGFPFHPGSSKILNVVQKTLGRRASDLSISYEVLRNFGNTSSPTALFALHRAIEAGGARAASARSPSVPAFSAYFVAIDLLRGVNPMSYRSSPAPQIQLVTQGRPIRTHSIMCRVAAVAPCSSSLSVRGSTVMLDVVR